MLYLFVALSFVSCKRNDSSNSSRHPNLLYVFADQFRKQAIGFMQQDPVISPNLDSFASEGMAFTNAISSCPICSPYRAMLMTGRFPMSTGITSNCMPGTDLEMKEDEITIGDVLKDNGYVSGYIGKWHLEIPSLNRASNPLDSARDPWDGWTPPGRRRHGFDFWYAYNSNAKHFEPNYWKDTPKRIDIDQWSVEHETDVAIAFMKEVPKGKPFALFISWNPPHNPYVAPEKYKAMYEGRELTARKNVVENAVFNQRFMPYLAAVTSCDDNFGRLLDFLDMEGLDENTIVVFSSDHGEMMGSHGRYAKSIWYDESIGIPFLIRWKNTIHPGREQMPFAVYNFMPTILGLMDLEIPETVEGKDYSALLLGLKQEKATSAVIASYGNPARLLAVGQAPSIWALQADTIHQMGIDWKKIGYRGLRTERFTYVVDRGRKKAGLKRYLYDNEVDPFQLDPIISDSIANDKMLDLNNELQDWLVKMHDPFQLN